MEDIDLDVNLDDVEVNSYAIPKGRFLAKVVSFQKKISKAGDKQFIQGEFLLIDTMDSGLEAGIVFSWDFGDLAFNEDSIDLSREARLVISLRDSVLDEINQLYFEHGRVNPLV